MTSPRSSRHLVDGLIECTDRPTVQFRRLFCWLGGQFRDGSASFMAKCSLQHLTVYMICPRATMGTPDRVDFASLRVRHCGNPCVTMPVGLSNQGSTGYLNVALQLLFHIPALRSAVLRLPLDRSKDPCRCPPLALQRLFACMQASSSGATVSTKELTQSLGWRLTEVSTADVSLVAVGSALGPRKPCRPAQSCGLARN